MDILIREDENLEWPTGTCRKTHIAVLAAITLIIGIYLINTTVLIAKDGILYIDIAKKIAGNPFKTISDTEQAPGYPFLIYLMHKTTGFFCNVQSLQGWIHSAQVVSLLGKLIATIAIYFVGGYYVGYRFSFWGVLILSILPDSVDFGCDALTDWPHIMFLAIGFLLLLWGVKCRNRRIFGYAGIAAGLGYLVRPECGQVVLYGSLWLLFNLIRPQGKMEKPRAAGALVLLLAGFAIIAVPYMGSKGYVLPEQNIWKLPAVFGNTGSAFNTTMYTAGLSVETMTGTAKLINNLCETLVYYFIPALAVGCWYYFRKQSKTSEQLFFPAAFVLFNVAKALWQPAYFGFLSRRHTLPLVALTIFYIPIGVYLFAGWLSGKAADSSPVAEEKRQRLFYILIAIGIGICAVKLVRMAPLRGEKQGYRDAAQWLHSNTTSADRIAVTDKRITFYAQRQGIEYDDEKIPDQANYVVRMIKSGNENPEYDKEWKEEYSTPVNRHEQSTKLVIYRIIH